MTAESFFSKNHCMKFPVFKKFKGGLVGSFSFFGLGFAFLSFFPVLRACVPLPFWTMGHYFLYLSRFGSLLSSPFLNYGASFPTPFMVWELAFLSLSKLWGFISYTFHGLGACFHIPFSVLRACVPLPFWIMVLHFRYLSRFGSLLFCPFLRFGIDFDLALFSIIGLRFPFSSWFRGLLSYIPFPSFGACFPSLSQS